MTLVLSVVIPTCDRNEILSLCLERLAPSVQTLEPSAYEVLVSDDSASGSARGLLEGSFSGVRWNAGPRRGPAANRNSGARAARGSVLVFIDDDCIPEPGLLAAYVAALRSDIATYEGRTTVRQGITTPMQTAPENLNGGVLWSCNLAMRRDAFEQIGGFDARFPIPHMEDVDFRNRIAAAGLTTIFVPDAVVDHPPRRLPWGWRLAKMHRASVLYMILHPPVHSLAWFLQNQFRARLSRIVRMPKSLDSLVALASIPFELAGIVWHWNSWKAWARATANARCE